MKAEVMQYGTMMRIVNTIRSLFAKQDHIPTAPNLKLYHSIHKLPLNIFIDCLVRQEYEKLIIEGKATEQQLRDCFEDLYTQYVQMAGGSDALSELYDTKRITVMQLRVKLFSLICQAIESAPTEELFKLLYSFPQYYPIQREYSTENISVVIKSMTPHYKSELISLMQELDIMKAKKKDNPEQHYTDEYFTGVLTEMESVFKTQIPDTISVGKFCAWIDKYKSYVKAIRKQQEQQK